MRLVRRLRQPNTEKSIETRFGSAYAPFLGRIRLPGESTEAAETLFLFCSELPQSLFKYCPGWKAHGTRVGVEVYEVLPVPPSPVLDLPNTLANHSIGGRISGPVALVRWKQLMVHGALRQPRSLVGPLDEIPQGLLPRVDTGIADDPEESYYSPHPSVELVLVCPDLQPAPFLEELAERFLVVAQLLPSFQLVHDFLELDFSVKRDSLG